MSVTTPPFPILTERLALRPLSASDAPRLSEIGGQPSVARMIMAATSPWPVAKVESWIAASAWADRLGFMLCIEEDGRLIGAIGIGSAPVSLAYWLDPSAHGRGLATEAARSFLAFIIARYAPEVILAEHYADNPASGRVLTKLGFIETARHVDRCSPARSEAAELIRYRLDHVALQLV